MKILYDDVSSEYSYPLSKKDVGKIKKYLPSGLSDIIKNIRFGCNTKTTQEGRTVKRGRFYDIKINFCLKNFQSIILAENKDYIEEIKRFGGKINFETRLIGWNKSNAKRYAYYILLHEISHIIYSENYLDAKLNSKSSVKEEQWCNNNSLQMLKNIEREEGITEN